MSLDDRDLEIQKLNSEIQKTKINARYNLIATFVGTTLVAVTASYFTFVTDTTKNEQTFDGGHRDFVSKFVEIAIDDDIERRQRLAKYFASVTLDESQKARWKEYSDYIDRLIEENPTKIANLEAELLEAGDEERAKLEARINFLEKQLSGTPTRSGAVYTEKPECAQISDALGRIYCIAQHEVAQGVSEVSGPDSNPRILQYARELGVDFSDDDIPWAGLFAGWVVSRAVPDETLPANMLQNRSWTKFGVETDSPQPGTIAVFWRGSPDGWQGHVGFYVDEDEKAYHILGGNQSNSVSVSRLAKDRLLSFRVPETNSGQAGAQSGE
ncbi:MAG TPA: TIGR02594 family protein [Thermohalobaculum sp.]|nr:TIGR02594 family protein [Thermohalobaculum sp.]